MEGIAPLGTLDPQHAVAQLAKALADPARAFAFMRGQERSGPNQRGSAILMTTDFGCELLRSIGGRNGHSVDHHNWLRGRRDREVP